MQLGNRLVRPASITLAPDQTRAYVTLSDEAGILVLDAVALQLHDVMPDDGTNNPSLVGVQTIRLPDGAAVDRAVIDPQGRALFVPDRFRAAIYVIDINPTSNSFHKLIRTLTFRAEDAPLGLRGIAVSSDGSRLYVAAPGVDLFGRDTVSLETRWFSISRNWKSLCLPKSFPRSLTLRGYRGYGQSGPRIRRRSIGASRRDLYPSTQSRYSEEEARGAVESHQVSTIDLTTFGEDPFNRALVPSLGLFNPQSIAYIPEDLFARMEEVNGRQEMVDRHPAYLAISTFNRVLEGDPRRDPNFPVVSLLSHPGVLQLDGGTLPATGSSTGQQRAVFAEAAGGNIALIRLTPKQSPTEKPRVVSGTRPTPQMLPDNVVFSPGAGNGLFLVTSRGLIEDAMFAYDARLMVRISEQGFQGRTNVYGSSAFISIKPNSISNPLDSIPINDLFPIIDVREIIDFMPAMGPSFKRPFSTMAESEGWYTVCHRSINSELFIPQVNPIHSALSPSTQPVMGSLPSPNSFPPSHLATTPTTSESTSARVERWIVRDRKRLD